MKLPLRGFFLLLGSLSSSVFGIDSISDGLSLNGASHMGRFKTRHLLKNTSAHFFGARFKIQPELEGETGFRRLRQEYLMTNC